MQAKPIYLWLIKIQRGSQLASLQHLAGYLCPHDQAKYFDHLAGKRKVNLNSLVAHALARIKIAELLGLDASENFLEFTDQASPRVHIKGMKTAWYLSVSHADDELALVLAPFPIGIDFETYDRDFHFVSWIDKFSPDERLVLESYEGEELVQIFHRYWTLKEAFYKASPYSFGQVMDYAVFQVRGDEVDLDLRIPDPLPAHWGCYHDLDLGIHGPMSSVVDDLKVEAFQVIKKLNPETKDWNFRFLYPTDNHIIALAYQGPRDVTIITNEISQNYMEHVTHAIDSQIRVLH